MEAFIGVINSGAPSAVAPTEVAHNSVEYQEVNNVAVISVDGGMAKKGMSGMCTSIASYDQIVKAIHTAEANDAVNTIVFRVDTPGGDVSGVDEVGDMIFNSKKRTITFYENMGASAGVWAFSAADEIHASETTLIGSIGVIATYMEAPENPDAPKQVAIVSKNAANKSCSLKGDCKEKMQTMLDTYEAMFYARVERNTGFDAERIKTTFNNGDVIFANQAKEAGFIKSVTTFAALLDNLVGLSYNVNPKSVPSASRGGKDTILNQGANMTFDRDDLDATEQAFKVLVANRDTLTNRNATLGVQIETLTADLEAKTEELSGLTASFEEKLTEAEGKLSAYKAEAEVRIAEAIAMGVSAEVAVQMLNAETPEAASNLAIAAKQSTGAVHQEGDAPKQSALLAYAEKNKGSIK